MPGQSGSATARSLVLLGVLAAALLLRLVGIDREIPHRMEPDSSLVFQMQRLEHDPALVQRDHGIGPYPLMPARAFALLPYPDVPVHASGPGDERVHLAAAARPFLVVRVGVALFSAAGVLLSWFLARRFLPGGAALLVPWFVGTSLLSILFAGQGRPHGIQATLALGAVLLAQRVRERPSLGRIAAAAACAGAAGATLQNGLLTVFPLAAGVYLGLAERGRAGALLRAGIACAAAAAVALPFFPGLPRIDAQGVHLGSDETGAHTIHPTLAGLGGVPRLVRMLWEFDPVLAVLAPLGAVLGIAAILRGRSALPRAARLDFAVVLAYVVPYLGALALDPNVQERFLLPLIPYLACLAASALARLAGATRGAPAQLLRAAFVAAPAVVAVSFARTAAAPDTLERAADWIRANVDPAQRILSTPGAVLPMLVEEEALRADLEDRSSLANPWFVYQSLLLDEPRQDSGDPRWKIRMVPISAWRGRRDLDYDRSVALIRDTASDYVLLENSVRMHAYFPTAELERAAASLGDLVYRWDGTIPGPDDGGIFEYSGTRQLARRLLAAKAFGPGIKIYRIRG